MEAKELRIGNLVQFNWSEKKEPLEVMDLSFDSNKLGLIPLNNRLGCTWRYSEIEGIPITEEWLERFGFKNSGSTWWDINIGKNNYEDLISVNIKGLEAWVGNIGDFYYAVKTKCEYIHQVQNLYFALTGEELKLEQ